METLSIITNFMFVTLAYPQTLITADGFVFDPNFLVTILAGTVLALAFQFILTAISVAGGVSAIGNIKSNYAKSQAEPKDSDLEDDYTFDQDNDVDTAMGVKITTVFGIWSVVTSCLALFGATALALNLNIVESESVNITTALVIWALFFLILFYLEAKIARTLIGNLISVATSSLRSSANLVESFFAPSPESKVENVIGNTIDKVRKEFDSGFDTDKISKVLDNFLNRVDNKIPDYENLKNDLEGIAKKSRNKNTAGKWMAIQQVLTKMISENESSDDPERHGKAKRLKDLMDTVVSKYEESPGKVGSVKNIIEEFTPLERQEIDEKIQQAKEFIASSKPNDLSIENIQKKFREILENPNVVTSMVSNNFMEMNLENIIAALDKNTGLEKENLENYADRIHGAVQSINKEFDKQNEDRLIKRIEKRVADFFNTTDRQELDYSLLKNDVKRIMDNPSDSLDIIKNRLSTFDTNTIRALITNNPYVKEEQIDTILDSIEGGKKEVLDKVDQIRTTAAQQIQIAKRKAIIKAEHTRATAASAAWWLVLTTILSGVAALVGGIVTM